jgi:plastocyanin
MTSRHAIFVAMTALAIGCGGSGNSGGPTSPSPPPGQNPPPNQPPPVATTTITITAAGVNPQRITVSPGTRVTFINNDTRPHEMNSDPHPNHGDCPAIDDVGFLQAGQTKLTGNLTVVRTCGFHDHNQPTLTSLQGQIIVQ